MKPTIYFAKKSEMTDFAKSFSKEHPANWYIKTTLECDHKVNERRKGMFLVTTEKLVQRLIVCGTCQKSRENNAFDRGVVATLKILENGNTDK